MVKRYLTMLSAFLIMLFVHYGNTLCGQTNNDSLILVLAQATDTNRIDILNQLSKSFQYIDPKEAIDYAIEAISSSEENSYAYGEAIGYFNLANAHRKLGDYDEAIEAYQKTAELNAAINNYGGIAEAYNGLGIAYNIIGDFDQSLESFLSALKTHEQSGDKSGIAHALNNIGIVNWYLGDLEESLKYYKQSLDIRKELGEAKDIAASLNNIGNTYSALDEHQKSLDYFLEALAIQEKRGDNDIVFALLINIGNANANLSNNDKALDYYAQGLVIAKGRDDKWGIAQTNNYLGNVYLKLNDFKKAESYFNRSMEVAKEINAKIVLKESYNNLSTLYSAKGDYKNALEYYQRFTAVKDSIFNETSSAQIAEMETRYESELQEAEIKELTIGKAVQDLELKRSENMKLFFIIASMLILLLATFMYYGFRQKKKANVLLRERNKLEMESKERAISLFGQQVSKEVASELLSESTNTGGKLLTACIMFLDIRNFTPFTENMDPNEVIQLQNDIFGFMIDAVSRHHGIINQFLGDGFMATFGAPASSMNDSNNAVLASLEILDQLKKNCASGELPPTRIGIGLHTGPVITGNIGTSERKQYSITGNSVILASRIEQLNKTYNTQLLISNEVLNNLEMPGLKTNNLGQVKLKGRTEPMEIIHIPVDA